MRVLVTRPLPDAERTAASLRDLGHEAVLMPLTQIVPTGVTLPQSGADIVVATSANALRFVPNLPVFLADRPFYAVGRATADAARRAGFSRILTGAGGADILARMICDAYPDGIHALFLAGEPRKPALEDILSAGGHQITVAVLYRNEPVHTENLDENLTIDAVLHYSRAAAEGFRALLATHVRQAELRRSAQLCLSADVADGLMEAGFSKVLVASMPDETALLALLPLLR